MNEFFLCLKNLTPYNSSMITNPILKSIVSLVMLSVVIIACSSSSQIEPINKPKCDHISYPGVGICIPQAPPVITCKDIILRNFTVFLPDPHGFDPDANGVGCENGEKH